MRALVVTVCVVCACAVWLPGAAAEQRLRVCGRELAETLTLLCRDRGGFNDLPPPHLRAPRSGGVAEDCCKQGCTLSTLQRYCRFDDVVKPKPQPQRTPPPRDTGACAGGEDDDDELFNVHLLHRVEGWCGTWRPASVAPPSGEVECTCSRGGGHELENVVRKGPRQTTRQPRQPPRQPLTTPTTRHPVITGTVKPYFANRPVVVSPLHTQRQPPTA